MRIFIFQCVYRGVKGDYCGQDKDCLSGSCCLIGKCWGNWKKQDKNEEEHYRYPTVSDGCSIDGLIDWDHE